MVCLWTFGIKSSSPLGQEMCSWTNQISKKHQKCLLANHSANHFQIGLSKLREKIDEEPENLDHWKELDVMDEERTKCMSDAEDKCGVRHLGTIPCSKALSAKGAGIDFLKLAL